MEWYPCLACGKSHPFRVMEGRRCPNQKIGSLGRAATPSAGVVKRDYSKSTSTRTDYIKPDATGATRFGRLPFRKVGRPLNSQKGETLRALKPWESEEPKVSRTTWFRRRAEARLKGGRKDG